MSRSIGEFLLSLNPFPEMPREQACTLALIHAVAIAAIAYSRRSMVLYGAIGAMIGSTVAACYKAWNAEESCTSIFLGALLGVAFGLSASRLATRSWQKADHIARLEESSRERMKGVFQEGLTLP
ncbi:MAG: hypothetical protein IT584_02265 [Chlamydiae bacterium]|nr:hypothetical protein [Chlamydiota bacterium]